MLVQVTCYYWKRSGSCEGQGILIMRSSTCSTHSLRPVCVVVNYLHYVYPVFVSCAVGLADNLPHQSTHCKLKTQAFFFVLSPVGLA